MYTKSIGLNFLPGVSVRVASWSSSFHASVTYACTSWSLQCESHASLHRTITRHHSVTRSRHRSTARSLDRSIACSLVHSNARTLETLLHPWGNIHGVVTATVCTNPQRVLNAFKEWCVGVLAAYESKRSPRAIE